MSAYKPELSWKGRVALTHLLRRQRAGVHLGGVNV